MYKENKLLLYMNCFDDREQQQNDDAQNEHQMHEYISSSVHLRTFFFVVFAAKSKQLCSVVVVGVYHHFIETLREAESCKCAYENCGVTQMLASLGRGCGTVDERMGGIVDTSEIRENFEKKANRKT